MNERIRELIYNFNNEVGVMWANEDKLKFAELIIQECIDVMDATAKDAKDTNMYMGDDVPTFTHQYAIKDHFGVE